MTLHHSKITKFFRSINYKFVATIFILILSNVHGVYAVANSSLKNDPNFECADIKLVYARESGAELNSLNYERFTTAFLETFEGSGLKIGIYELGTKVGGYDNSSYPSPGIGIETWQRFKTSIGAFVSAGESYSYGESVKEGAREMVYFVKNYHVLCPNTKIVLAGYSQGAQVVSLSLQSLEPEEIYTALTFGDPKLYLPEGKLDSVTLSTPACREGVEAYSPYRANVPDCYAYKGILGGYIPYQPSDEFDGKLKAYCQFHDIICSAFVDLDRWYSGHASYKESGAYYSASKDVYNMVFDIASSPRKNVAIMFDSTNSMTPFFKKYKNDAIKTAKKVLEEGGKVSLYTFGDLKERDIEKLCDFETCSEENIEKLTNSIKLEEGDDIPESILSGAYKIMKELRWDAGANKNLFIISDAPSLNPDRDGITLDDVVDLSYEIDPVHIYILTDESSAYSHEELASRTGGEIYIYQTDDTAFDMFEEAVESNAIQEIIDSGTPSISSIDNLSLENIDDSSIKLSFLTDGLAAILIVNDDILGFLENSETIITDIDFSRPTTICLAPVSTNGFRGETVCEVYNPEVFIPKVPNTGRH